LCTILSFLTFHNYSHLQVEEKKDEVTVETEADVETAPKEEAEVGTLDKK
jgi:hypothetical protein